MANFDPEILAIVKRLQTARMDLMKTQPFYALLLMHLKFALDLTCETAYTDGERIAFNPDFLKELDDRELQFVLMHEVLHVVLQHCFRHQSDYETEAFDVACDIVVNSNIMHSFGDDVRKITLRKYGELMHQTPDGQEGYLFSAEEVYKWVLAWMQQTGKGKKKQDKSRDTSDSDGDEADAEDDGADNDKGKESSDDTDDGDGTDDSEDSEDDSDGDGEGSSEDGEGEGSSENKNEDGKGGKNKGKSEKGRKSGKSGGKGTGQGSGQDNENGQGQGGPSYGTEGDTRGKQDLPEEKTVPGQFDDHSFWDGDDEEQTQKSTWLNRMVDATQIMKNLEGGNGRGTVPEGILREIKHLTQSQLDWKTILNDFIQEEINDYSFSPPDRRFDDSPFFLPDYNEKDEHAEDILFMIDTSGSMSDAQIAQCYSEIKGAIDQFNGKLKGWLGFFDAMVVPPIPFTDEDEFKVIRPFGGGGTSFQCVLDYVRDEMEKTLDKLPASIIYLTDGFAPWPEEKDAMDIPVLWLINNELANPPWGKVARIPSALP